MAVKFSYQKLNLKFTFNAKTSRGILKERFVWLIIAKEGNTTGIGEAAPLEGLSIDYNNDFEKNLANILESLNGIAIQEWQRVIFDPVLNNFPSIRMALEMAFYDLFREGKRKYFSNEFIKGNIKIPINGLIWMGDKELMKKRVDQKINDGYNTLKLKIGGINFEDEKNILEYIRSLYSYHKLTIRLDANGAFSNEIVLEKLKELSAFDIHSIEQPISPGHPNKMAEICNKSPVSVALDEELIGYYTYEQKQRLLEYINPQYLILKPTLLGGFNACLDWIDIARSKNIGWWITSSLESNIGLNALAQYVSSFDNPLPQGLGTGQLFHNNISSPLSINKGFLYYDINKEWDLKFLFSSEN